jgi:hypothetical protein
MYKRACQMKSEKILQNYLQHECFLYGLLFSSPARRGVPDVLIINPKGRVVFVELKSPSGRGRIHPLQQYEINKLRAAGVSAYILYTQEEVDNLIESLKNK